MSVGMAVGSAVGAAVEGSAVGAPVAPLVGISDGWSDGCAVVGWAVSPGPKVGCIVGLRRQQSMLPAALTTVNLFSFPFGQLPPTALSEQDGHGHVSEHGMQEPPADAQQHKRGPHVWMHESDRRAVVHSTAHRGNSSARPVSSFILQNGCTSFVPRAMSGLRLGVNIMLPMHLRKYFVDTTRQPPFARVVARIYVRGPASS
mmetsp:Transcript_17956/g.56036  ORF Transcript_17956/g.56036 Transcript_17956/m.56036 type:complete len:202 (+) Transcript_17956:924-1529(+)